MCAARRAAATLTLAKAQGDSRGGADARHLLPHLLATRITTYMEDGGKLDEAQMLVNHAGPRATNIYDRSGDAVSLNEVEKIRF